MVLVEGGTIPSEEEAAFNAIRCELYKCSSCQIDARFARFNHPYKLFETRTGRCGEWCNCFTAMCIALGHDARAAHDYTDHVWTEVFIEQWQRWVHMDSCENVFDQPLLYEKGWGKKLTYVISIGPDEILDTTSRYVLDKELNRQRRETINEHWLKELLAKLNT